MINSVNFLQLKKSLLMANFGVVASWAILVIAFMVYAAYPMEGFKPGELVYFIKFMLWNLVPHVVSATLVHLSRESLAGLISMVVGVSLAETGSALLLVWVFFIEPDAQGGLIFIFLPAYVVLIPVLAFAVGHLFSRSFSSRRNP